MRQRYRISKEGIANNLVIREYAILGKERKGTFDSRPIKDEYALIYQENYSGDAIKASISKGKDDLIATLRTTNLFPAGQIAVIIADSVIELYLFPEDRSVELSFNDVEQFVTA